MADKTEKEDKTNTEVEEIFTDLQGRPDVDVDDADAALDALSLEVDDDTGEDPADLQVDDDAETASTTQTGGADTTPQVSGVSPAVFVAEVKTSRLQVINSRAELLESKKIEATNAKARAERVIEGSQEKIKKAKEDGNTDAEMQAQQDYLDARDTVRNANTMLSEIDNSRNGLLRELGELGWDAKTNTFRETNLDTAILERAGLKGDAQTARATDTNRYSKHSDAFVKHNPWFTDKAHTEDADLLRSLDRKLFKEGKLDKDDPKYFEELGRRFNLVSPGKFRDLNGNLIATGTRQRGNGSGGTSTAQPSGGTGVRRALEVTDPKKVKLTTEDLKQMEVFGFDPNSMKHRENWLREKRTLARASNAARA